MSQDKISIDLNKLIAKDIATRQAISLVKREIIHDIAAQKKVVTIVVDFQNIESVSRSFADEMLNLRKEIEKKKMEIDFMNTKKEVYDMFKIVSMARKTKPRPIKIKNYDINHLSYQF